MSLNLSRRRCSIRQATESLLGENCHLTSDLHLVVDRFRQVESPGDWFRLASSSNFLVQSLIVGSAVERCCLRGTSLCLELPVLWESMLDRWLSHRVAARNFAEDFQYRFVAAAIASRLAFLIESRVNDPAKRLRGPKKGRRLCQIGPAFSSSRARTESSPSVVQQVRRLPVRALVAGCSLASSRPRRNDREDSTMVPVAAKVALPSRLAKRNCPSFYWQRNFGHCQVAQDLNPESDLQKLELTELELTEYWAIDLSGSNLLRNGRSSEVAALADQHPVSRNSGRFRRGHRAKVPFAPQFVAGPNGQRASPALADWILRCDLSEEFAASRSFGCQLTNHRCLAESLAGLAECF